MDNKNLPAYPRPIATDPKGDVHLCSEPEFIGFTNREKVAAMCLQGLLANSRLSTGAHLYTLATECADALLTHLEKTAQ